MESNPEDITIVNASLQPKDGQPLARIPNSIFFDIPALSEQKSDISFMLPSNEHFCEQMQRLDIRKSDFIVCYDKAGMISAPRAYFMLKTFGAPNVFILDGTFAKWQLEEKPVEEGDSENAWVRKRLSEPKEDDFDYKLNTEKVMTLDQVDKLVAQKNANYKILDSRLLSTFEQGSIPTSVSLPFTEVLNTDRTFKSPQQLIDIFESLGITQDNKESPEVVFSCQGGITACILEAAFNDIERGTSKVYDGSYEEYGKKRS